MHTLHSRAIRFNIYVQKAQEFFLSSFQGTNFVDENVTANKEYEYRVTAVNEAGPGEPSDSSGSIAAKPEKGKIAFRLEIFILSNKTVFI